jgi:hypothetical protein
MKTVLLLIIAVSTAVAGPVPKPRLFPMQEGNYWILESSIGDQKIIRCDSETNKLIEVTGLTERDVVLYGSPTSSKFLRWDPVRSKPRRILNLQPMKHRNTTFVAGDRPCDELLVELYPLVNPITTVAGKFTGCSVLWITTKDPSLPACRDLLTEKIYLAPGIGPIVVQGWGDRMYQLVAARVNGVLIGSGK